MPGVSDGRTRDVGLTVEALDRRSPEPLWGPGDHRVRGRPSSRSIFLDPGIKMAFIDNSFTDV